MKEQLTHYSSKLAYEIDSWDLQDAINKGEPIIVIDTRSPSAFEQEHIPGSINIPHREMTEDTTSGLNKEYLVVAYCDGIGCNASTKGSLRLAQLGFRVKELIGGLDWWKRDGYPTSQRMEKSSTGCGC